VGAQPGRDERASPSRRSPPGWQQELRRNVRGALVVLGVGNRERGDDGAGPEVAERLAARGLACAFDCGTAPENYVAQVEALGAAHVVFVDAADLGAAAGTVAFMPAGELPVQSVSTHSAGLAPLVEFLEAGCGARCWLLAIQPEHVAQGRGLSGPVGAAVQQITSSPVWRELPA